MTSAPPLPAGPPFAGRSLSGVLTSAAAALGAEGFTNSLQLPRTRRAVVVMVDGLGKALLKRYAGHAPFLRSVLERDAATLQVAFPTTTAASLSSLGTGLEPGRHGLVGYDVLDPERDKVINQLGGWDPLTDPRSWQPHPTVFERLAATRPMSVDDTCRRASAFDDPGVDAVTVSLPAFEDSALTEASLRGSRFVGAKTLQARFQKAKEELHAATGPVLLYLYLNELDKAGHQHGTGSEQWLYALEEIDGAARRLSAAVPRDTLLMLTGDHGMVDVPESGRIDYAELPALVDGVRHTAGEPRFVQVHFEPDASETVRESTASAWQEAFADQAWILTREEAVRAGWFGAVDARVAPRIGDLLVAAHGPVALYDGRRVAPAAFEMVGHHGAPTRAEREVPLLMMHRPRR
ncbi:alkaline phosphatase family protein [Citricoccus sp. K5]|uniref:alkaline phosphatase family protein n=1 Tax=Citricoccus sp. K5 TaxID=2653135 RepID=UPI0012F152DA|nr:nucleotide pyrophosphatase/phosphodiesterase family protein [Citricoccus sp. K5]VXB44190.1 Putative AlkP superfamily pyrophosphatase or phosphodiesterase [Citricoccus sp. K5]